MDSRQLRYFAAIYEAGSLSRASEATRIATSALSHHLTNLEANLGAALFVRRPRGLEPTAAGMRLYEHAKIILKSMTVAESDVRSAGGEAVGAISVGMAHSCVKAIGVALLSEVIGSYPRLKLSLSESLPGSILIHMLNSEVDLAVVFNPPPDPRLAIEPLLEEELYCIGKRDVIGPPGRPITFEEVLRLPLTMPRSGLSAHAVMDNSTLLKRLETAALLQMNSVNATIGALLAGLCCMIASRHFLSEALAERRLVSRPIVQPALKRTLYLCHLAGRTPTFADETVRALILKLIRKSVQKGAWEATFIGAPSPLPRSR